MPSRIGLPDHVDDDCLVIVTNESTAEIGRRRQRLRSRSQLSRDLVERGETIVEDILGHEQIEIVRLPMTEVEAGERGASRQEEPLLAAEEAFEEILLEAPEPTNRQGGRRPATERTGTPRTGAAGRGGRRSGVTSARPPAAT
jgi:hypothetical protein